MKIISIRGEIGDLKLKCSFEGCKTKGTTFINKKSYCKKHFPEVRKKIREAQDG